MTKKIFIAICASSLLAGGLSGCGDWKQDPLDGKKGDFADGKPVPTKPDLTKPLPSGSVKVYVPDFQSFQEGVKAEFTITARVLVEGYVADVNVENLADFPGATYNKANGLFSWTPPVGFVSSVGENGVIATRPLKIKAYGHKPDDQVLVGEEERPMYISREFKVPDIVSITKPENWLREGFTMLVPVVVYDKDAVESDRNTWPKIILQSPAGSKSLAGLTTLYRDEALGNNQYRSYLQVDLRDIEVSDAVDTFKVTMIAASRFGKLSVPRDMDLDVYTSFATPTSTWTQAAPLRITATTPTTYTFLITDPKMEAWLSLDRLFNLPVGSNLTCSQAGRGLLNCTFTWTPTETQTGTFEISAYIKSRNFDSRDVMQQTKTLFFRTEVLPKGI